MNPVCLYFKVHQPYRLKKYQVKDIDVCHCYEDEVTDRESINQLANNCCLPANEIIYKQIIQRVHEVIPWAGHANYAASKGGVNLMMKP